MLIRNPFYFQQLSLKILNRIYYYKKRFYRYFLSIIRINIKFKLKGSLESFWIDNISCSNPDIQNSLIVSKADRILKGRLDIFSLGEKNVDKIDWHLDYRSGYRWKPGIFYKDYRIVDLNNNADVKIPWEISRAHHFLILGQAYLITKDERYTAKFIEQITSWINENPLMKSINWTCTMEVAIRAVNWIYALKMFNSSPLLQDATKHKIVLSLYQHGYFIFRNPEKANYNNHNHYLSDLAGQIHLGILFKGFPEADLWLKEGIFEFFKEIRSQILPTGPTYERSISYHRLVTEIISYTVIHLENNGFEIPLDIKYRVETMFEFIMYYLRPDGTAPIIGDQDDGRFLPFGINRNTDHRYLLSIGATYFKRSDFKFFSSGYSQDVCFIIGEGAKEKFDSIENGNHILQSKAFKDAGFFIMRDNTNYIFINNSGKGRYPEVSAGTHTHSDLLSFDLTLSGIHFLVDSGTYLYSADPKERKLFRSTSMHNTVVVDNKDQNVIKESELWGFERNAIPRLIKWETNDRYDIFEGEHNGYCRLENPLVHRRLIYFDKNSISIKIKDFFESSGSHNIKAYFNFHNEINVNKIDNYLIAEKDGLKLLIKSKNENFDVKIEDSHISESYGDKKPAKRAYFETENKFNPCFEIGIFVVQ